MSTIRKTPSGSQRVGDPGQDLRRLGLVVDRVEGGDRGRTLWCSARVGDVAHLEASRWSGPALRLRAGRLDRLGGEVVAGEAAVREGRRHQVDRVALPQPMSATSMPARSRSVRPGTSGRIVVDQRGVVDGGRCPRPSAGGTGVGAVGNAAAVAEAVDDLLLHPGQQRDELHHARQVVGAGGPGQAGRVFGGSR